MQRKKQNQDLSDEKKLMIGRHFGLTFYRLAIKKFGSREGIFESGIVTERELYKLLRGGNPTLQKIVLLAKKLGVKPFRLLAFDPEEEIPYVGPNGKIQYPNKK